MLVRSIKSGLELLEHFWVNRLGFVFADAHNVADGHCCDKLSLGELANDGGWLLAALLLGQRVALQRAHSLHVSVIHCLLVELFAQFEIDGGALEGRRGVERVRTIVVFDQLDDRGRHAPDLA